MSEADEGRKAASLKSIEMSMRQIVRIMETMNENFVAFAKKIEAWDPDATTATDKAQLSLVDTPMKGDDETS